LQDDVDAELSDAVPLYRFDRGAGLVRSIPADPIEHILRYRLVNYRPPHFSCRTPLKGVDRTPLKGVSCTPLIVGALDAAPLAVFGELARNLPAPMIVARLRETKVSPHEAARVVLQVSEPPMVSAARGISVWDGFPAIPFRGADPTRLRIYFGEQPPRDVLMPAIDRSPSRPGRSTSAMPRAFRD
jgi:hypothetical protein